MTIQHRFKANRVYTKDVIKIKQKGKYKYGRKKTDEKTKNRNSRRDFK